MQLIQSLISFKFQPRFSSDPSHQIQLTTTVTRIYRNKTDENGKFASKMGFLNCILLQNISHSHPFARLYISSNLYISQFSPKKGSFFILMCIPPPFNVTSFHICIADYTSVFSSFGSLQVKVSLINVYKFITNRLKISPIFGPQLPITKHSRFPLIEFN